jgi:Ca2+-binding RTX toxin-like protein
VGVETSPDIQGHPRVCGCAACQAGTTAAPAEPQNSVIFTVIDTTGGGGAPSYVTGLLSSDEYRWNNNAPGTGLTLTYGFMTSMPLYAQWNDGNNPDWFGNEWGTFKAFTAVQQAAVHSAVQNYEEVCNVDFVYMANGDNATVRFGSARLDPNSAAHAYYPQRSDNGDWEGDVWFNSGVPDTATQTPGSYGYFVTLHEIGHTLGLKHSHEWDNGGTALPYAEDNRQYTVMSYQGHPNYDIEPSSLLLYDIAALQFLYGANMATRAGDSVYSWSANATFISCIWDGGGTDTIDASNQSRRVSINLKAGSFSSVGSNAGGDAVNNLAIAFNCVIENAVGGGGNDTLIGNAIANRLDGGAGDDLLRGGGGGDTFIGGFGFDTLSYEDLVWGGSDGVTVNLETGEASGRAAGDQFSGIEAIRGSSSWDTLIGDARNNRLYGEGGNNTLVGGAGADYLDGGFSSADTASYATSNAGVTINLVAGTGIGGHAQGDVLVNVEEIIGSGYADTLLGGGIAGRLSGGAGNDFLDGALAMNGGSGDDIFVVRSAGTYINEVAGEGFDEARILINEVSIGTEVERIVFLGSGDFSVSAGDSASTIIGGSGRDRINAGGGNDTLEGGAGDDSLDGGAGADVLRGGSGFDTASYASTIGPEGVTLNLATGVHTGDAAGDVFDSIELLSGSNRADTFIGGSGNDTFAGAGGNDSIDGGAGSDTVVFRGSEREYSVVTQGNVTTVTPLRRALEWIEGIDTLTSIETIRFAGAIVNRAPVVFASSSVQARNTILQLSSYIWADELDSDLIVSYGFRDTTIGSGSFKVGSIVQAENQIFSVSAGQLSSVTFTTGALDALQVRAFDGVDWGDWRNFSITAPLNHAPSVSVQSILATRGTISLAATSLWSSISDADGDAITRYSFWDSTSGSGYFQVNGVAQAAKARIEVTAAELANTQFVLGGPGSSDLLWVQAFDGVSWSTSESLTITAPVNRAPIVTVNNLTPAHGTASLAGANLFSVSDADGDAITQYRFYDGAVGNGRLWLNGVAFAEKQALNPIDAADLGDLTFTTSATGPDLLWVQAYDGASWSDWKSFTVNAVPNVAPVVSVRTITPGRNDTSLAATELWSSITDADGDAITQYRFYDGTAGNGRLWLNGVALAEKQALNPIDAADLGDLTFTTSATGPDLLWVQAYDGMAWSDWKSFTVNPVQNAAPIVTVRTINPTRGDASLAATDLWSSITDADGDAITQYRFYDGTVGNGRLWLNGTALAEKQPLNPIDAADLGGLTFATSATGSDLLWVQAYDGTAWSDWKSFTVNAVANTPPTLSTISQSAARNSVVAGTALFTPAQDADGDAIVMYRFWDSTTAAGSGSFRVNGQIKSAATAVDIMAGQLGSIEFVAGSQAGTDLLWVTAYDGVSWSQSKSLQLTTFASS